MNKKLTVEQSARRVIYALIRAGFKEDEALDIFWGLYHGTAWNQFDLAVAVNEEYRKAKPCPLCKLPMGQHEGLEDCPTL